MMRYNQSQEIIDMRTRMGQPDRSGDYWKPEERERLREMFYAGAGISEMALEFHRTEPAVLQQVVIMGLYESAGGPVKHKKRKKKHGCLCDTCKAHPTLCPRCKQGREG